MGLGRPNHLLHMIGLADQGRVGSREANGQVTVTSTKQDRWERHKRAIVGGSTGGSEPNQRIGRKIVDSGWNVGWTAMGEVVGKGVREGSRAWGWMGGLGLGTCSSMIWS